MDDYQATFGSREISGVVKTLADDSRDQLFMSLFKRGQYQTPWDPNKVEWDDERLSRRLAPLVGLTSPSPSAKLTKRIVKHGVCFRIAEHVVIPAERLFYERFGGQLVPNARGVVDLQVENLRKKVNRTKEKLAGDTLLGEVDPADYPGNTLVDPVEYPVSTGVAAASWATAGTKIASVEIDRVVRDYRKTVNMAPGLALINSTTEGYLLANTEVQENGRQPLQAANMVLSADHLAEDVLGGFRLGGLRWKKHVGTYQDASSSYDDAIAKGDTDDTNDFIPDATVIVLPPEEVLSDTLGLAECGVYVPKVLWSQNPEDGFERMTPGFASYCEFSSSPAGVKVFVEWIGLFYLPFAQAVAVRKTTTS